MTEVRTSSLCERPCAGIEDTPEASIGTGGQEEQRHRKVHSLIDKVYDRTNLTEAWKHVRENKGSAGIDGLTIAAFREREDELLARLHEQLRDRTYRPRAVKRVAIPKAGGGTRNLGIPSVADRVESDEDRSLPLETTQEGPNLQSLERPDHGARTAHGCIPSLLAHTS
jgi:RNA-directed DNA polymerase